MKKSNAKFNIVPYLFILPYFLGLSIFYLIPYMITILNSVFSIQTQEYIGAQNYVSVFKNSAFLLASKNTAKFIITCIPILLIISLIIALLVSCFKNPRTLKAVFLLSYAIPVSSVALFWQFLFNENGYINTLLIKSDYNSIDFMNSNFAFWVLIGSYIWRNCGYNMLLWLSGIENIPKQYYEAVKVDGGGFFACFIYVTLPSMKGTFALVFILSLLNSFKVFREAYLVSGAYPHESIYLLQHLFNNWFLNFDINRLSAASVVLSFALFLLIIPLLKIYNKN